MPGLLRQHSQGASALLAVVSVAAALGGVIGGRIMTYRLSSGGVKKLIAGLLLILAAKMIWNLLR